MENEELAKALDLKGPQPEIRQGLVEVAKARHRFVGKQIALAIRFRLEYRRAEKAAIPDRGAR